MKLRKLFIATAATTLVAFGLGTTSSVVAAPSANSGSAALEKTNITVGVLPIADYTAVYWAKDKGYFKKEGLTVTLKPVQGGPIGAQKVATDQLDFAISNTITTAFATKQGIPIKTVVLTSALGPDELVVYVKPDSPIKSVADINGKTIGINATQNVGDVTMRNLLDSKGLQKVKPRYVEVPFPQMLPGVENGSIDIGYAPEPFAAAALKAGMRQIADLSAADGPNAHLAVSNVVSGDTFIKNNPNTVKAFMRAVYAAGGDIAKHETEWRNWVAGVAHLPKGLAQHMPMPIFFDTYHPKAMQRVVEMMKKQGLLPKGYDVKDYVYNP